MKNILILSVVALMGCANNSPVVVPPSAEAITKSPASGKDMDAPKERVEIDPYLLEPCPDFSPMTSTNPTPKEVLEQKKKDVLVRRDCADRHDSLIKIVKKAFNLQ